ncbi:SN-glycerol-3-phosphate ABC transporter, ATP-binding protein [Oceanicola granulosus HTCC2516]|uniref:SN-glycerol-3-phosphate ABC transporter, ATP-binding protein n=1 Tax=Oceanicola granulosus (strain ATCC BAA-861 / DSM 15982 / KCTC 12143 / HTCC2516) TaxID=314256 RepID=Q2CHD3_OCEGH|nr:sn-glycerol-3-phosphate ABC transporter ATP-binding protein UgpC [Oceanicola granulosus]EAR52106.1 SN-glycerol-3-phosphate ABC transporter, ATP-binding protein [Oceanicola granulosus HTCC2516]
MATVELRNIKKRFGKTEVIHGVSTEIDDGEFIVIVGPSGCGKSTLLRMVAGLESVSDGEIRIDGSRVNEREPMERDIAMVFQNYALYPHMTVRQNMGYGLKIAGTPKRQIAAKVDEAAALLQLSDYLDRRPKALSGGQRQRVAMGRAIVREPKVFLFDEPLSNLDAKLRVQMRLEIKELQERIGVTSLYVTHDQVEAMTMADRMIVMNAGRAEQIGKPLDVYERPATLFAAQFIGSPSMNVLDGRIEAGEMRLGSAALGPAPAGLPDGPVKLGLRPEHALPDPDSPLRLRVRLSEPLGANTLLHGQLDQAEAPFTACLAGVHRTNGSGEIIPLRVAPEAIHLFSPETGDRLN